MSEQCSNCRYFKNNLPFTSHCLRFPPVNIKTIGNGYDSNIVDNFGIWPVVEARSWCGEWRPFNLEKGDKIK
jgi:hypothetical protein